MSWYVSYMKKKDHVKLRAIRPKPTEVLVSANSVGNELKFSLPTSSTCSTVSPTSVSTMASESTDPIVSTATIAKSTRSMPSMVTRVTPKTNSNITSKERKSELLNRLIGLRKNEENHDEAYHWGMSLAARYRKLTSYQQAVTRREIEKVFFQAQFNTPREFTPDKPSESTFADSEDVKMESSESDEKLIIVFVEIKKVHHSADELSEVSTAS
ncbi:hypothetical protein EB796_004469 [Bugula neritina]|uniref:Uncharacterized protein n=1 Tax=Bugula neritina TaxID=10212 RepID=A0A7J7KEZ4_BUGNE|nr:hypothetical protein EB796_004469 [Bugula neritina]